MKQLLLSLIRFYRREISPLRPPCCRFIPTCSEYALEAVEKYGVFRGGWLALRRLARCHPFHRQKSVEYDPDPYPCQPLADGEGPLRPSGPPPS